MTAEGAENDHILSTLQNIQPSQPTQKLCESLINERAPDVSTTFNSWHLI